MKDYIFNIPDNTLQSELSEEVQQLIASLNAIYPSFPMIGTKSIGGRRLIHIRMDSTYSKVELEGLFLLYGLDWQILCIRDTEPTVTIVEGATPVTTSEYLTEHLSEKAEFLPFINDKVLMNLDGTTAVVFVTLADDIYLPTYAGTEALKL